MSAKKTDVIHLISDLKRIVEKIPADFGGGSPLSKSFLMAYLTIEYDLKIYVEIGVYRGRSFFPMANISKLVNGRAYGIDAYDLATAKQYDPKVIIYQQINAFLESLDFQRIFHEVNELREELKLVDHTEIINKPSSLAAKYFENNNIFIDMLHIDGNHDTKSVLDDIALYVPLVREGGFVVLDDINWLSVKPSLNRLKLNCDTIFNNGCFAILRVGNPKKQTTILEKHRLGILHSLVENYELNQTNKKPLLEKSGIPKVSVVVISFNQEKYIAECLEGIFAQKGDFALELIIGDDCSTDKTLKIIRNYANYFQISQFEVRILKTENNLGMTKNLQRCLAACTGKYIAICEGDDYWIDSYKLQKQINFLVIHPECALCFSDIYIYNQSRQEYSIFELQQSLDAQVITTKELILNYYIGNMSCCMYDAQFIQIIPDNFYDLYIGDWMFNIYYSQFGDIGHIRERASVYRKHDKGVWASLTFPDIAKKLYYHINEYNQFLDYQYDNEFSICQERISSQHPDAFNKFPLDIAIIDDVFPHLLSGFRFQEFISYLRGFDKIKIYCTGQSIHLLGKKTLAELVTDFKRKQLNYAENIEILKPNTMIDAKLVYTVFLGNTFTHLEKIEQLKIPFVFTLYPGGMFGLNNARSDIMLKRVTSSPCFRKVIVTQKITYDYLLEKQFCTPDQIELIFGLVTPLDQINSDYSGKKHFGIDKSTLDICFVGHKYTQRGVDKGYDVFINVAKQLCKSHSDIFFHVVGGFDERVIDISEIRDKIFFYGNKEMEWFDEFYKDKDVILSPNIPFMIFDGSFDGFPTGTCVDAGLRKTAIFCTDELHLNHQFVDGGDIVIIPHHTLQIVNILERYYSNPEQIKMISENGCRRIKQLYGYDSQILPRIKLLKEQIKQAEKTKKSILGAMAPKKKQTNKERIVQSCFSILVRVKRVCPQWLKNIVLYGLGKLHSNSRLFRAIRNIVPESILSFYYKVRDANTHHIEST